MPYSTAQKNQFKISLFKWYLFKSQKRSEEKEIRYKSYSKFGW